MNAPVYRHPSSKPPSIPPPAGSVRSRLTDDSFVAEALLDAWVRSGEVTRAGALLTTRDGRRFVLRDAVRVLGRRNGETDPYGLTGRIEALRDFIRQGASVSADGIRLGPAVYDVEFGVVAYRIGSPDQSGMNPRVI
jgi:hypothetical protein